MIILIIILLFILFILWIIICYLQSLYYENRNRKSGLSVKNIPLPNNTHLKRFYNNVIKDYNKCELFAIAGTALGCIRHNDIIPWDDDIDVGMDKSKINLFLKISKEKGYKIEPVFFGYKIYKNDYFIDVFIFKYFEGKYNYVSNKARKMWPREYFLNKHEVYPLVYRKFGNIEVPAPNKLRKYCNRAFKNWYKTVIYKTPHRLSFIETLLININPFIPKKWSFKRGKFRNKHK